MYRIDKPIPEEWIRLYLEISSRNLKLVYLCTHDSDGGWSGDVFPDDYAEDAHNFCLKIIDLIENGNWNYGDPAFGFEVFTKFGGEAIFTSEDLDAYFDDMLYQLAFP
jgi:hypothetical protein